MARDRQLSPSSGGGGGMTPYQDPFMSLHREMNRLFDDVFRGFGAPAMRQGGVGGMLQPEIDVSESEGEIRICADLPGVSQQDVDVTLDDDILTIKAERRHERGEDKESWHVVERSHGMYQRSIRLPSGLDSEHVDARFENGVLTICIPKTHEAQRQRKIQVQGSGRGASQGGEGMAAGARSNDPSQGQGQGHSQAPGMASQGHGAAPHSQHMQDGEGAQHASPSNGGAQGHGQHQQSRPS